MICSTCGGQVIWRGPLANLTHTECQDCDAINAQVPDEDEEIEPFCMRCDDTGCDFCGQECER